ncbi:hypothetical protein DHEL01_v211494 [Diaporthe helianthi]|uniref:Protein kinase domain-containing protein n=1 Tax=Diaporthe helianthi TaxID=158607 RepID=A0A2P5HIP8_DIAHE|nr:hypothetical protein DHEL01_v211494 [Diaporthe helianthi]
MDASAHISEAYWNRCMADDVHSRDELVRFCGYPSLLIYAMEYMEHGNFNGLGRRLSGASLNSPVYLKDSELWGIFLCFFRAIVGLAYPGQWDGGLNPAYQQPPTQEEFIPMDFGQPRSTRDGLVHLDINDRNVMLGEDRSAVQGANGHGHSSVPIFKVGDMGYVCAFREQHYQQFTRTWNKVFDWESLAADDTAGKFDWWTNSYSVSGPSPTRLRVIVDL